MLTTIRGEVMTTLRQRYPNMGPGQTHRQSIRWMEGDDIISWARRVVADTLNAVTEGKKHDPR